VLVPCHDDDDGGMQLPNPLEYFGYIYNFTTFLAGPAFEYKLYADAIDETTSGKRPSGVLPGLYKLLQVRRITPFQ